MLFNAVNDNGPCVSQFCALHLMHAGTHVGGWTAKEIHEAVLTTFGLSEKRYRLNQLRYDLRKLKGHDLLERDGSRYAYRLTNSRFHHQPDAKHRPESRLEAAYHRADAAIQKVVRFARRRLTRRLLTVALI